MRGVTLKPVLKDLHGHTKRLHEWKALSVGRAHTVTGKRYRTDLTPSTADADMLKLVSFQRKSLGGF